MSWLVGLPLGIFRILSGLLMLLLRLAGPILLILLAVWLVRRLRGQSPRRERQSPPREPDFDGPVYTVDYQDVTDEAGEPKEDPGQGTEE